MGVSIGAAMNHVCKKLAVLADRIMEVLDLENLELYGMPILEYQSSMHEKT